MRIIKLFLITLLSVLCLASCAWPYDLPQDDAETNKPESASTENITPYTLVFDNDKYTFTGDPAALRSDGETLEIIKGGEYELSGKLSDGSLLINVDGAEQVKLSLRGFELYSSSSAPIYVKNAAEVVIVAERNTENKIESLCEDGIAVLSYANLTVTSQGCLNICGYVIQENKS